MYDLELDEFVHDDPDIGAEFFSDANGYLHVWIRPGGTLRLNENQAQAFFSWLKSSYDEEGNAKKQYNLLKIKTTPYVKGN